MPDSKQLQVELTRAHQALERVANSARGKGLVDDLRGEINAGTPAILWQALLSDCMRVVHSAVTADGEIGEDEVDAVAGMVAFAAHHYAAALSAQYGEFVTIDARSTRPFLDRYAADRGPFGRGARLHWPGLALCRRAAELGNREALERYEAIMKWLIPAACRIGGVVEADRRWRGRIDEIDELRRMLAGGAAVASSTTDLRVQVFLDRTGVFNAVQQASSIFDNDPMDVESVHRDARASFEYLVTRAVAPSSVTSSKFLLVLGDSGSGKTHLLRGFRRHVQENGRGFIAYAQLQSSTEDYSRYLLLNLVDSLSHRYSTQSGERTGLVELASGLLRLARPAVRARGERLTDDTWEGPGNLTDYINELVDDLIDDGDLGNFDPDLLRVMLYALRKDRKILSRVYKYLRCEGMSAHDRHWIGDVVPRTDKDDPYWMMRSLGLLAAATQRALVFMVDQADLARFEHSSTKIFENAINALYRIVSEVSSAVAVVACLSDVYTAVRDMLNKPAIDRLENDPPIAKLKINRSYVEIEAIVERRLSWLFAENGTVHRPESPVYPIPERELRQLENHRLRDVLEWCHQFQVQCAVAGKIINADEESVVVEARSSEADLDHIAALWHDATHAQGLDVPDEEHEYFEAIGIAARAYADEAGLTLVGATRDKAVLRVRMARGGEGFELAIAITNAGYQGGGFTKQLDALRKAAGDAVPIALRTLEFPRGPTSDKALGKLIKAGGRGAYVDESTLRLLVAFQGFKPPCSPDRFTAWQRRDRPISGARVVAEIFGGELPRTVAMDAVPSRVAADRSEPTSRRVVITPAAAEPRTRGDAPAAMAEARVRGDAPPAAPEPRMRGEAASSVFTAVVDATGDPRVEPQAAAGRRGAKAGGSASESGARGMRSAVAGAGGASESGARGMRHAIAGAGAASESGVRGMRSAMTGSSDGRQDRSGATPARGAAVARGTRAPSEPIAIAPLDVPPAPPPGLPPLPSPASFAPRGGDPMASQPPRVANPPPVPAAAATPAVGPPRVRPASEGERSAVSIARPPMTAVRIGNSTSLEAPEPRVLDPAALLRHIAVLGDSVIDKAAVVLNLIEQVIERDAPVVVLDRTGQLSGYADPSWPERASDPTRAQRLAERMEVRLFTPGARSGRPLAQAWIPDVSRMSEQDATRIIQQSANAIAALVRRHGGQVDAARLAILSEAVGVLARRVAGGLAELIALIGGRDAALVERSGGYDERLFARLAQDLERARGDADPGDAAELLTADTLVGRTAAGRVPLAIVNLQAFDEPAAIQLWGAHVMASLHRQAAGSGAGALRALFVVDDAELFMPAGAAKPASKEVLHELLKHGRAAGIGLVLASSSPAELDYKSRELIETWLLAKMVDPKAIERLKPLLESRPLVGRKLSKLEARRLVLLQGAESVDLERCAALLRIAQLSPQHAAQLAARTGPRSPEHATLPTSGKHAHRDALPR